MAKKSQAREDVWLQCSECGDLNYRVSVNTKNMTDKLKAGVKKHCPRSRNHTLHKIRRRS
ncbi:MAG: 50S ribosomal protein L33 [Planctomycetota bacterium]|jgi:ribosomal protein L33|nr:50S ribosomal protein L33 [Planctomycetota bacterium]